MQLCLNVFQYHITIFLKIRISHSIVILVSVLNATHLAGFSLKQKSKTDDGVIRIKEKHNKENV